MAILAKRLSGHNLKGDYWNALNSVMRKFLNEVLVCTIFHKNWKGWGFFVVDLTWNDPYIFLLEDNEVWVTMGHTPGRINCQASTPRSYVVDTPQSQIWCNQCNLRVVPENTTSEQVNSEQETPSVPESKTQQKPLSFTSQ